LPLITVLGYIVFVIKRCQNCQRELNDIITLQQAVGNTATTMAVYAIWQSE